MKKVIPAALLITLALTAAVPAFASDVNVEANGQSFAFKPAVVMLPKGKPTTIHFKATPGAPHGLNVPALGINNIIITQAGTKVTVTPKTAGTFPAHCTIVCGAGHANMAMKFIVK
ncbi:MAG: hypothetical protein NVSMB64_10300 [Candidatus Velthaea sp.]